MLTPRNNRNDRVSYSESSPSSVLFFRSIASIFYSYLTHVATERDSQPKQVPSHLFSNSQIPVYSMIIMKGLTIILSSLSLILEGNYVSFGAMIYYSDACILQLLSSLSIVLSRLEFSDLITFPKLTHAVFLFLRSLFTSNMLIVSILPKDLFQYFIRLLVSGVSCDGM